MNTFVFHFFFSHKLLVHINENLTIISQYAEGNHYNAANGELLRFGNATCFYFQCDSSFVTKWLTNKFQNKFPEGLAWFLKFRNKILTNNLSCNFFFDVLFIHLLIFIYLFLFIYLFFLESSPELSFWRTREVAHITSKFEKLWRNSPIMQEISLDTNEI